MGITLYTAPDCLRCKIVKAFLAERQLPYEAIDFKADAPAFNTFYRAQRTHIYRNPEGIEFPLFDDGAVIRQGSGEIIAYLLAGHALEGAVTRSDLLHGWISGLYLSQCPADQEDHFVELVQHLSKGGLTVCMQTDGRNPELLGRLIRTGSLTRIQVNILPEAGYAALNGAAPEKETLAETIALARAFADHQIRFLAMPIPSAEGARWPNRDEAASAAERLFTACGDHQLPYGIAAVTPEMPQGMRGLEPISDALMLKYRSAAREFLFKADLQKCE